MLAEHLHKTVGQLCGEGDAMSDDEARSWPIFKKIQREESPAR